jgi:drug/metabolite transporter (DMT)-like permease
MMKTAWWAVILVFISTMFTSFGQLLWKISATNLELSFFSIITNYALLGGFVLYGIALGLLLLGLRAGELSVLYPIIALSFGWVTIISYIFLGESINITRIIGIIAIISGILFINIPEKKERGAHHGN